MPNADSLEYLVSLNSYCGEASPDSHVCRPLQAYKTCAWFHSFDVFGVNSLVRIFVFLLLLKPGKVFRIVYTPEPSPWPPPNLLQLVQSPRTGQLGSHKTQLSPWRVAQVLNSAVPGLRRYLNGPCNTTHHTACCWCCFTFLAAKIWSDRTCPPILSSCPAAWVLSLPSSWPLPASEEHLRSDSRLQFFHVFPRANMSKLLWKYWEWRWMTTWPMTTVRGQGTGLLSKEARRRQRHSSTSCAFWARRVTKSEVWSRTLWIRRFRIDSLVLICPAQRCPASLIDDRLFRICCQHFQQLLGWNLGANATIASEHAGQRDIRKTMGNHGKSGTHDRIWPESA